MAWFRLYIWSTNRTKMYVTMSKATVQDLERTKAFPQWQTDWTSEYITGSGADLYALKTREGELTALGAYEVRERTMGVHIIYMESQVESNPTKTKTPKYWGIGRALIAWGIKLSVDAGFNGDVTLDAKTSELAKHYEADFGAIPVPGPRAGAAPRYLICDEAAQLIFTDYLEEV